MFSLYILNVLFYCLLASTVAVSLSILHMLPICSLWLFLGLLFVSGTLWFKTIKCVGIDFFQFNFLHIHSASCILKSFLNSSNFSTITPSNITCSPFSPGTSITSMLDSSLYHSHQLTSWHYMLEMTLDLSFTSLVHLLSFGFQQFYFSFLTFHLGSITTQPLHNLVWVFNFLLYVRIFY